MKFFSPFPQNNSKKESYIPMVVCLLETKITNLFRTNPIQKFGTRANEALIVTEAFAFCSFQKNLKTGTNDFNAYVTLQVIQSKQFRKQN